MIHRDLRPQVFVVPPARHDDFGKDISMTSMTGTRRIVISAVAVAAAMFVAVMMLASRSTSSAMDGSSPPNASSGDMPGMAMPGMDMATPTPSGDMQGMDMSGMDHGPGDATASSPPPTSSGDMPGMDMPGMDSGSGDAHRTSPGLEMAGESASARPIAPVLGTFGGGTSAVLFAAGFLRRKDRAASRAKKATRLAGRTRK